MAKKIIPAVIVLIIVLPFLLRNKMLYSAAKSGSLVEVSILLALGADPNAQDMWKNTPLMAAVMSGNPSVVSELAASGADVNLKNGAEWTALMMAVSADQEPMVQALIENCADIAPETKKGVSALSLSDKNANIKMLLSNAENLRGKHCSEKKQSK